MTKCVRMQGRDARPVTDKNNPMIQIAVLDLPAPAIVK